MIIHILWDLLRWGYLVGWKSNIPEELNLLKMLNLLEPPTATRGFSCRGYLYLQFTFAFAGVWYRGGRRD